MTRTITKKAGGDTKLPLTTQKAVEPEIDAVFESDTEPAIAPTEPSIEVIQDEQAGTATVTLVNGAVLTLKEPKAKDFVYLASKMQSAPAWQRTGVMSVYLLSHFMISDLVISDPKKGDQHLKLNFDEFMDLLEDDDLERVGAVFACFPNVVQRLGKIFGNDKQRKAV